ncbi:MULTISPECIES: hypothetical protein [unclassified Prochlorococcus]|uniref:hypothetical protein n=1 Tax=unclassified Prochlorococcus TaxID=2627481 RepID=UPI000533ADC3|nr:MULTISPECIES: hypothetical protein [unclassified Prochlorococcus]KGG15561.1 putative 7kD DNA-binding domain [Prochlorococcus sp. MIT 0602]KGG17841.1 putative 7kD DNA-binding domain [Prochlorococcus sp. MIT 0603]
MSLKAIECPDGVCHSHHGGHAVPRTAMQKNLQNHGREWCERLAERIYEMSVDTYSQTVVPSLHASGWQRRHLDWEFKLADKSSEPDETLVEGIINATESFLRSTEVHKLFIQELVQGTFEEATEDHLKSRCVRAIIEDEIMNMLEQRKEEIINGLSKKLLEGSTKDLNVARKSALESITEVQKLLLNHSQSI